MKKEMIKTIISKFKYENGNYYQAVQYFKQSFIELTEEDFKSIESVTSSLLVDKLREFQEFYNNDNHQFHLSMMI